MPVNTSPEALDRIRAAAAALPGVCEAPHRFGGVEFRLGAREVAHAHGSRLVDIPFPKRVRDELVAAGRARPHHVLPDSGWVSVWIENAADVDNAIELIRRSYEIASAQAARRAQLRAGEPG